MLGPFYRWENQGSGRLRPQHHLDSNVALPSLANNGGQEPVTQGSQSRATPRGSCGSSRSPTGRGGRACVPCTQMPCPRGPGFSPDHLTHQPQRTAADSTCLPPTSSAETQNPGWGVGFWVRGLGIRKPPSQLAGGTSLGPAQLQPLSSRRAGHPPPQGWAAFLSVGAGTRGPGLTPSCPCCTTPGHPLPVGCGDPAGPAVGCPAYGQRWSQKSPPFCTAHQPLSLWPPLPTHAH